MAPGVNASARVRETVLLAKRDGLKVVVTKSPKPLEFSAVPIGASSCSESGTVGYLPIDRR